VKPLSNKMLCCFVFFLFLTPETFALQSEEKSADSISRLQKKIKELESTNERLSKSTRELSLQNQTLLSIHSLNQEFEKKVNQLESRNVLLDEQLKSLHQKIEKIESKDSDIGIASVVLGAAGLIMTGLSIVIAIFAVWGYKNIKKQASELAAEKSKVMVQEKIENGGFDEVVYKATEKSIYRGILSAQDFPEQNGDIDESM